MPWLHLCCYNNASMCRAVTVRLVNCFIIQQRCAGPGVQESTPTGDSVFQQEPEQDQEWIFLIGTGPGAGVIFSAQWF